ncbi:serine/threonine protein kinase, partial [Streptomyces griseus]|nr:serine/threonine protein kinase [Streptomyces griseus]
PRLGSARNKAAAVRKRRITLGVAALALCAAVVVGGLLATGGGDDGPAPQDSENSAPATP